ncbi:hypothetical protein ACET3Z_027928 [Daucus carota]
MSQRTQTFEELTNMLTPVQWNRIKTLHTKTLQALQSTSRNQQTYSRILDPRSSYLLSCPSFTFSKML